MKKVIIKSLDMGGVVRGNLNRQDVSETLHKAWDIFLQIILKGIM